MKYLYKKIILLFSEIKKIPVFQATTLIASGSLLLWVIIKIIRYALITPVSFDGAMNLNVAASLIRGEGYGFFYNIFFPFPAQTDGPFILPAAFMFWIGGISPLTSQAISLGYVIAFILLGLTLFKRLGLPAWLSIIGTLGYLCVPGFIDTGMNGYGEIPVMVWYLAGLLIIGKSFRTTDGSNKLYFIAGALFAIAYLTKFVALIVIIPSVFITILLTIGRPHWLSSLISMMFGFLLPIFCWEVFRFIEIESKVGGFFQWWKLQLGQVLHQSGARKLCISPKCIFINGTEHFSKLSLLVDVPIVFFFFYLTTSIASAFKCALNKWISKERRFYFACLATTAFSYFIWFIFITPSSMLWLRRIFCGLLIIQCLAIVSFFYAFKKNGLFFNGLKSKKLYLILFSLFIFIPTLIGQLYFSKSNIVVLPVNTPYHTTEFSNLVNNIRKLPSDAFIFGTGWWKAPVIALYSGRRIYDIQHWTPEEINKLRKKYFIVDGYLKNLSRIEADNVLASTNHRVIADSDAGALYEILSVYDYAPFSLSEKDLPFLKTEMVFTKKDYPYTRGFYTKDLADTESWCWMNITGALILKRSSEDRLSILLDIPENLIDSNGLDPLKIKFYNKECLNEEVVLSKAGNKELRLNLTCSAWKKEQPFLLTIKANHHMPFKRQIDADNRMLSVYVKSISLHQSKSQDFLYYAPP